MKKIVVLLILANLVLVAPTPAACADRLEPLYGVATDDRAKTLTITVAASGCTEKSHFTFEFDGDTLVFRRTMPDSCKAMPQRFAITYTLKELGIAPESSFCIGNPISLRDHVHY
ncbi:MAG: hypothetical protein ABFD98_16485 [Syntrophobacteraceae bacterium]|nr:hypothetical protein [Desulfobacteraceae bacterium]